MLGNPFMQHREAGPDMRKYADDTMVYENLHIILYFLFIILIHNNTDGTGDRDKPSSISST